MLHRIAMSMTLHSFKAKTPALAIKRGGFDRYRRRAAGLACLLLCACFDRDLAEGFCEDDCTELWTPACEERCGLERPDDCSELETRCPIVVRGGTDEILPVTGAGGEDGPLLTDNEPPPSQDSGGEASQPPAAGSDDPDEPDGDAPTAGRDDLAKPPPGAEGPCGELCPKRRPFCDVELQECIECVDDDDCRQKENGRYCVDRHCIGCMASADCEDPLASHCDETVGACVGCRTAADCADVSEGSTALPVCDVEGRRCVQCSGTDYGACGKNAASSVALVCDSQAASCTSLEVRSASLCDACLSDAHCADGMRCVPEVFEGKTLEHVCLWAFGRDGAPKSCGDDDARPFSSERLAVTTIDGEQVDVCALAATTCEAKSQAVVQPCAGPDAEASCGIPRLNDGLCRPRAGDPAGPYACTVPCQTSHDCEPGYACNGGEAGSFCDLTRGACASPADCSEGQQCLERVCMP